MTFNNMIPLSSPRRKMAMQRKPKLKVGNPMANLKRKMTGSLKMGRTR